jgi:hypothetical protein
VGPQVTTYRYATARLNLSGVLESHLSTWEVRHQCREAFSLSLPPRIPSASNTRFQPLRLGLNPTASTQTARSPQAGLCSVSASAPRNEASYHPDKSNFPKVAKMGNDGGSIPKRRELVKEAARQPSATTLKEAATENLTHAWSFCPLSSTILDPSNTVSDWRGILYNYESILQCLLPSSDTAVPESQEEAFKLTGIKSLKDVVKLKFSMRKDDKGREFRACPISLKELGASTKAVYVVPCGHVFAEVAMKEVAGPESAAAAKEEERGCPECSEAFQSSNVIPVLPTLDAETARLAVRLEDLKSSGLTHSLRKDKSNGKKKRKAGDDGEADEAVKKARKTKDKGIESRINNAMTASLTAKVLAEQEEKNKRRKVADMHKSSTAVR